MTRQARSTRRGAALATLVLSLTLFAPTPAMSDNLNDQKNAVNASIDDLQEELAGTSKELLAAYSKLKTTQAQLTTARKALAKARAAEAAAAKKDAELATRLAAAEKAQANAQQALAKGQEALKKTQTSTGQFASQVYRNNGISPQLTLLLGSGSPDEFASRTAMVDYVMRLQSGSVRNLEQQRASNATIQDRLTSVQEQVAVLRKQAAENLKITQAARAEAVRQEAKVAAAVKAQAKAVAAIKARKSEEDAKMASLRAEQARITKLLRDRAMRAKSRNGGAPGYTGPTGGLLNNPVPGAPITSGFGYRMHPIYHYVRLHAGTDFGVACGSPVYAAAAGDVIRAGWAGGYGNQVMIDHGWINGGGLATTYNHLSSFVVRGGHVNRGQLIAYSGTTGSSTGCHLHFEVRVNGVPKNPMNYL